VGIEHYGYVILVAVIGMAIVFAFLAILSLLMSAIRAVFGREHRPAEAPSNASPVPETAAVIETAPTWLLAAAVALIELEKARPRPDPLPWVSDRGRRADVRST
jgi:sodium pump decarboxylase gamma subunit